MKYPIKFTFLGFYLNSIVDKGGFVELDTIESMINRKDVFIYLKEKFGNELDISLYTEEEIKELEEYFHTLNSAIDDGRKFGVKENGICLLVAYCFEALQRYP